MDKNDFPSIYRNSRSEAKRLGETELWWESFHNNVAYARHIEAARHNCSRTRPTGATMWQIPVRGW